MTIEQYRALFLERMKVRLAGKPEVTVDEMNAAVLEVLEETCLEYGSFTDGSGQKMIAVRLKEELE